MAKKTAKKVTYKSVVLPDGNSMLRDVHSGEVYSAARVGRGATGLVKLFCAPLGQEIATIGEFPPDLFPHHSPLTTNLCQAACLGHALGDANLKRLHLDFPGGNLSAIQNFLDLAYVRFLVSAQVEWQGAARDLPAMFNVLVAQLDSLVLEIELPPHGGKQFEYCLLVRAVLTGNFLTDVR